MQTKEVGGKILFSIFTNGLRFCWDIISIASNANIGGLLLHQCADSIRRPDLQLSGLLAAL
jgi:hypothetical protein